MKRAKDAEDASQGRRSGESTTPTEVPFLEPDGSIAPQEEWCNRMRSYFPNDGADWPAMWTDIKYKIDTGTLGTDD